jgi:hypothetical protein
VWNIVKDLNLKKSEREREKREKRRDNATRGMAFIITKHGNRKVTAVKFHRHCPLVLPVKVSWKHGKALGNEEVAEI